MLNQRAQQPGTALNFLVSLRGLMRHAINVGLRADDPTIGVRGPRFRPGGFYSWTEADIAAFETKHPIGSQARLAFALLLYTAQRRADVVQLGRQHLRDGMLHVRQNKTGKPLTIPLHPELRAVIDATPVEHLTFLVTRQGKPFRANTFTKWFGRKCQAAGLPPHASVHGLRKAACRRLAEAGCSAPIIQSISGHATLREVQRYIEAAEQAGLARQGIEAVTRTKTVKPAG
jgi:integrase